MHAEKADQSINNRTCIVTRKTLPKDHMLRFVVAPDFSVAPDLKYNLPGRGCWVKAERFVLEKAVKKDLFRRALRQDVHVKPDLPEWVDHLLTRKALGAMSLARKAGLILTGSVKVHKAVCSGKAIFFLHALEGSDKEYRNFIKSCSIDQATCSIMEKIFTGEELSLALGKSNVIYVAGISGMPTKVAIKCMEFLQIYRNYNAAEKSEYFLGHVDDIEAMRKQDE